MVFSERASAELWIVRILAVVAGMFLNIVVLRLRKQLYPAWDCAVVGIRVGAGAMVPSASAELWEAEGAQRRRPCHSPTYRGFHSSHNHSTYRRSHSRNNPTLMGAAGAYILWR